MIKVKIEKMKRNKRDYLVTKLIRLQLMKGKIINLNKKLMKKINTKYLYHFMKDYKYKPKMLNLNKGILIKL